MDASSAARAALTDGAGGAATGVGSQAQTPRTAEFRFAGFSALRLASLGLCVAALCWGMWVTRQLARDAPQTVVSLRLSRLVSDFVTSQARSNTPDDVAAIQTALYMKSLDAVLKERSARGATILVAEAVIGASATDITDDVRAETLARMANILPQSEALPQAAAMPQGPALAQEVGVQTSAPALDMVRARNPRDIAPSLQK